MFCREARRTLKSLIHDFSPSLFDFSLWIFNRIQTAWVKWSAFRHIVRSLAEALNPYGLKLGFISQRPIGHWRATERPDTQRHSSAHVPADLSHTSRFPLRKTRFDVFSLRERRIVASAVRLNTCSLVASWCDAQDDSSSSESDDSPEVVLPSLKRRVFFRGKGVDIPDL